MANKFESKLDSNIQISEQKPNWRDRKRSETSEIETVRTCKLDASLQID